MGSCHSKDKVRIGIVGVPDTGKRTFINSFCGLWSTDPGAADIKNITPNPTEYPHVKHRHIVLVNFPGFLFESERLEHGVGKTVCFDLKEYMKRYKTKMKECDVFIVFTSERVYDSVSWVAKTCHELKKKLLFVRSKFDQIQSEDPAYHDAKNGNRLLKDLKADYVCKLNEVALAIGLDQIKEWDVFIISGKFFKVQLGMWDVTPLNEAILRHLNINKRTLFIKICQEAEDVPKKMSRSKKKLKEQLEEKVRLLEERGKEIDDLKHATNNLQFKYDKAIADIDKMTRVVNTSFYTKAANQRFLGGKAVIINNINFSGGQQKRKGAEMDTGKVKDALEKFNLSVDTNTDKTVGEMLDIVRAQGKADHSTHGCFVCCIMTHGNHGKVCGSDGSAIDILELVNPVSGCTCPRLAGKPEVCSGNCLAGKPKVFIIQACQGNANQGAVLSDAGPPRAIGTYISTEADVFLGLATVPGYVAYRNENRGAHYINKVVEVLEREGEKQDLLTMMTMVNDEMNKDHGSIPFCCSTLRRKLYFVLPNQGQGLDA